MKTKVAAVVLSSLITFFLVEALYRIYLRLSGAAGPLVGPLNLTEPVVLEPDAELGWKNKAGKYEFLYGAGGKKYPVVVNVGQSGERLHALSVSGEREKADKAEVAVIGCSFTFGWGVSDDDTFTARLAREYPQFHFVNLACGGYSTYQALLSLERRYRTRPPPRFVIYGFPAFHAERNVASVQWQYVLFVFSKRGHAQVPYVTLGTDGRLQRHPPEGFAYPPFFASSKVLSRYYLWIQSKRDRRREGERRVTEALLLALQEWAEARGAKLIVAVLDRDKYAQYEAFLQSHAISYARATPHYASLPYDDHPDWHFHRDVAEQLGQRLRALIAESGAGSPFAHGDIPPGADVPHE
ncbi:MAG: SGNH/GDSL hydrolase family protein [Thermodesulfobacteriota bacterium]|jgi:hypothetical protein